MKPVLILGDRLKKSSAKQQLKMTMPKLLTIGNSVGFVIGSRLLRSIDWKRGDYLSYSYDEEKDELTVMNFTSKMRREKIAVHKKH